MVLLPGAAPPSPSSQADWETVLHLGLILGGPALCLPQMPARPSSCAPRPLLPKATALPRTSGRNATQRPTPFLTLPARVHSPLPAAPAWNPQPMPGTARPPGSAGQGCPCSRPPGAGQVRHPYSCPHARAAPVPPTFPGPLGRPPCRPGFWGPFPRQPTRVPEGAQLGARLLTGTRSGALVPSPPGALWAPPVCAEVSGAEDKKARRPVPGSRWNEVPAAGVRPTAAADTRLPT